MPHVTVKLWPANTEKGLGDEITKAVPSTLRYRAELVSLEVEEVRAADWTEKVDSSLSAHA